ncbi:hypothetical protein [Jiangella anatolica]|uniref:Uncharacterized protein n=1 Tax=Jiangella anatolica TaxID=2670374 RepID=A0A2W2BH48_9ACTN|nr:hypothetical protein [Jiangella anatolica]PZF79628.1 hypothetical protein C1I92_30255 [Jiangella anatolica]
MVSFSRRSALAGVLATAGGAAAVAAAVTRPDEALPDDPAAGLAAVDEGSDEATLAHEARLMARLHVPALG